MTGFQYKPRREVLEYSEQTLKQLFAMAAGDHTKSETAALLGVSRQTLYTFFEKHPDALQAWNDGRLAGKASLRRLVHRTAMEDPATLRKLVEWRKIYKPVDDEGTQQADKIARKVVSKSEAVQRVLELLQKTELAKTTKRVHARSLPAPDTE
jgi:DNA-binding NtrC family response regulator